MTSSSANDLKRAVPVTAQHVADRLGVARPTVSTILSGGRSNTRVSIKLRERVLKAAAEMGYRPNTAAQAIRKGRFDAIGVISSADAARGGMPWPTLYALQSRAAQHDMHLSMGILPDQDLTDLAGLPKIVREWCVDGLLVSYTAGVPPLMMEHMERNRIPAVWMNVKREYDCVHLDDFGGSFGATEELLRLGHRRIVFHGNGPTGEHYSVADRYDGYAAAMIRAGFKPKPLFCKDVNLVAGELPNAQLQMKPLVSLFTAADRPTAILTVGREADVLFAAHQARLQVPADLSIISITEINSVVMGVQCTQMRLHNYGMGWRAFEVLQKKIDRPEEPVDPVSVYCTFDPGQTLAPPRGDAKA